jgi:hypothetical protein
MDNCRRLLKDEGSLGNQIYEHTLAKVNASGCLAARAAAGGAGCASPRLTLSQGGSFLCGEQLSKFGDDPIAAAAILGFRRRRNFLGQFDR